MQICWGRAGTEMCYHGVLSSLRKSLHMLRFLLGFEPVYEQFWRWLNKTEVATPSICTSQGWISFSRANPHLPPAAIKMQMIVSDFIMCPLFCFVVLEEGAAKGLLKVVTPCFSLPYPSCPHWASYQLLEESIYLIRSVLACCQNRRTWS